MKTIIYFISICFCLCFFACNNDIEPVDSTKYFPYGELYPENLYYMNMPRPADSYNYPVYPGMKEWAAFKTSDEMVEACQVPKEKLSKMSTQALIQAIWEYPLKSEIFWASGFTFLSSFENVFLENYAYLELIKRKDAGEALFERLSLVNPLTPFPQLESKVLELVVLQDVFLSQLSDNKKVKIVEFAFTHDDIRENDPAWVNSSLTYLTRPVTWVLIGRAMVSAGYSPFIETVNDNAELKFFLNGWQPDSYSVSGKTGYVYMEPQYSSILQVIINFGESFIND